MNELGKILLVFILFAIVVSAVLEVAPNIGSFTPDFEPFTMPDFEPLPTLEPFTIPTIQPTMASPEPQKNSDVLSGLSVQFSEDGSCGMIQYLPPWGRVTFEGAQRILQTDTDIWHSDLEQARGPLLGHYYWMLPTCANMPQYGWADMIGTLYGVDLKPHYEAWKNG